jgi:transposase
MVQSLEQSLWRRCDYNWCELKRGDIVIMENLNVHRATGVSATIEAAHARAAYLSPYSQDLNPIGTRFLRFKSLLLSAAQRTVNTVWETRGKVLDEFSGSEWRNHMGHCGFRYI